MSAIRKRPIEALYRRLLFTYKHLRKVNTYYSGAGANERWEKYVADHGDGISLTITHDYFDGRNPLYGPVQAMSWYVRRYWAALDYLDKRPVKRILELGCSFGVGAWLLTDVAQEVVALDVNPEAIRVAQRLFPEAKYVCQGYKEYFAEHPDARFDVILQAAGPVPTADVGWLLGYCERAFFIEAALGASDFGRALSYNCVLFGKNERGFAWSYPKYYVSFEYLRRILHARRHHLPFPR